MKYLLKIFKFIVKIALLVRKYIWCKMMFVVMRVIDLIPCIFMYF